MIKQLWNNYKRYINISKKESICAVAFGIIGAFSETLSIYLLAKLITSLDSNKEFINSNIFASNYIGKKYSIIFF